MNLIRLISSDITYLKNSEVSAIKELSLNILDIAMNSVKAKADTVYITLTETEDTFKIEIEDNGTGMTKEIYESVTDPFCTTRTTRKVGMGIPLLKLSAEQTGGYFEIQTKYKDDFPDEHGTKTTALFYKNHMDFTPLGDIVSSLVTLIQGNDEINWNFVHSFGEKEVRLRTEELKQILGDIPLSSFEVISWISEYLKEQYAEMN